MVLQDSNPYGKVLHASTIWCTFITSKSRHHERAATHLWGKGRDRELVMRDVTQSLFGPVGRFNFRKNKGVKLDESLWATMMGGTFEKPLIDEFADEEAEKKAEHAAFELYQTGKHGLYLGIVDPQAPYLVAKHLFRSIHNNHVQDFCRRGFTFDIHQHLSLLIRSSERRDRLMIWRRLLSWLEAVNNLPAQARDFAAFELGMTRARMAASNLLRTLGNRTQNQELRSYVAMALGMLRWKRIVKDIAAMYKTEMESNVREAIRHAILYTATAKDWSLTETAR